MYWSVYYDVHFDKYGQEKFSQLANESNHSTADAIIVSVPKTIKFQNLEVIHHNEE